VIATLDCEALPLDSRLKRRIDRLEKIITVRLGVEADQIGA
jgi:hypothetical protein